MGFLSGAKAQGKAGAGPGRPVPASASKVADRTKNKTVGRYGGLGAGRAKLSRLRDGRYRVKVLKTYDFDGRNHDFFMCEVEVVNAAEGSACKVGETVMFSYMVDKGDCLDMNGPKVVSFTLSALQYATEEDFNATFPEGSQARADLMNRVADIELDETEIGPQPLAGQLLMAQAWGNGKTAPDGTEYQDYAWFPNEEEEA